MKSESDNGSGSLKNDYTK